jgi:predicted nucleic acid-binding Zn ribbon protein
MPTYSYQCPDKHITEEHRRMLDLMGDAVCSTCEKPAKFIITVSKVKPTFGNQDTLWSMREGKRLGTR